MDLSVAGRDQSAAVKPNNLAEGMSSPIVTKWISQAWSSHQLEKDGLN
jgi:hypothetical protein